jgi:D-3-phosphoglycerate dehydrogenase
VIGTVGVMLGGAGVNIADMDVGRVSADSATMVLTLTDEVPLRLVEQLRAAPGILSVKVLRG